jgi:MazG family protein
MTGSKFNEFVQIVERLRKECPWDKEQTNDSIKAATIEEAYEVVDAIDNKDYDELKKELGDLLLHVVFHTVIAEESNHFKINDVIDSIQEKIIRRHPHVFGDKEVSSAEEVKTNWEEIKLSEGRTNLLDGMPPSLPALQLAHRIQEKVSKVGFDWERKEDVWKKVVEEIEEMHQSELEGTHDELEGEIGDVIFALVNYARFLRVNPENALRKTNNKFIKRFGYIEDKITESGRKLSESTLEEMDKYWEESKNIVD